MTAVVLALLPLLFVLGFLTWTMTMGAREQKRADAWAEGFLSGQAKAVRAHDAH
jgi:hypothetical protein